MKYQVGDEFLSLVKNERTGVQIGDTLVIIHVNGDYVLDYKVSPKHDTYKRDDGGYSYKHTTIWWFGETSLDKFAIPLTMVPDKDLFTVRVSGKYPGVTPMIYTKEIDAIIQKHENCFNLKKSGVILDQWILDYFFGDNQ